LSEKADRLFLQIYTRFKVGKNYQPQAGVGSRKNEGWILV